MANQTDQQSNASSADARPITQAESNYGGKVKQSEPVLNHYIEGALIEVALYLATTPGIPSDVAEAMDEVMEWAKQRHLEELRDLEQSRLALIERPFVQVLATLIVLVVFFLPEILGLWFPSNP